MVHLIILSFIIYRIDYLETQDLGIYYLEGLLFGVFRKKRIYYL